MICKALKNKEIAAAGLDVTVPEPIPTDHKLLSLSNCYILPHIGRFSVKIQNIVVILINIL